MVAISTVYNKRVADRLLKQLPGENLQNIY